MLNRVLTLGTINPAMTFRLNGLDLIGYAVWGSFPLRFEPSALTTRVTSIDNTIATIHTASDSPYNRLFRAE
jgi:hypothetical protein